MTTLPTELICAIIESVASDQRAEPLQFDNSCNVKLRWDSVVGLSMASKLFRTIILETWFHELYLSSEEDLDYPTTSWPAVFDWVREIHFVVEGSADAWNLSRFERVHSIRIDLLDTASYSFPFSEIPPSLRNLNIRNLNWPSPRVYATIAKTFHNIRTLHIHQPRVWCGLCNLCEIPNFHPASTEKLHYSGGIGLPAHYAIMLSSMESLERVQLTVGNTGRSQTPMNSRQNENLWSGECAACMRNMYSDEAFRTAWVAKKKAHPTLPGEQMERNGKHPEELDGAKRPPMLREVVWDFWAVDGDLDSMDELNY